MIITFLKLDTARLECNDVCTIVRQGIKCQTRNRNDTGQGDGRSPHGQQLVHIICQNKLDASKRRTAKTCQKSNSYCTQNIRISRTNALQEANYDLIAGNS